MSSNQLIRILCLALVYLSSCEAGVYSRCGFARNLLRNGIQNYADLGTWTCIAYHESGFNTKAINRDSSDYGILQISSYYWCSDSNTAGKGCNITCKSLLSNDISMDIQCARYIYDETERQKGNGFLAWVVYDRYCLGDQSSWISGCNW